MRCGKINLKLETIKDYHCLRPIRQRNLEEKGRGEIRSRVKGRGEARPEERGSGKYP